MNQDFQWLDKFCQTEILYSDVMLSNLHSCHVSERGCRVIFSFWFSILYLSGDLEKRVCSLQ
jgi:hypothetical protein